jgi:hypothetical protein
MVGLLQAMPGTELHQRFHRQGRLLGHTTGSNVDGSTNFIPHMNRETVVTPRDFRAHVSTLVAAHELEQKGGG